MDLKNLYVIKEVGRTPASDYYWSQRDECWTGELKEATQYGSREYAERVLAGIPSKRGDARYRIAEHRHERHLADLTGEEREEEWEEERIRRQKNRPGYTADEAKNLGKRPAAV